MTANAAVNAQFAAISYALTVNSEPAAGGSTSPSGVTNHAYGAVVAVTASANPGFVFSGWGGACSGTGACSVTMDAAKTVTANFTLNTYALTVSKTGEGTITSNPAGITCGSDCTETFNHGAVVVLTAAPATGYSFTGWSGGVCSGTGTCSVTMDAAKSATATFTINSYPLTVAVSPAGGGTTLPAAGEHSYTHGAVVPMSATPATGYTFTGWSGACTGTGACQVTMDGAKSITANFTLNAYALTVTKSGNGSGTVTSDPAGINCGADCSENYAHGTVVVLTAAPAATSTFTGWSGACTGIGTCTVTIDEVTNVTANFTLNTYALTVSKTGDGTITSDPAGINCGSDWAESHNHGTSVALTAAPAAA